MIEEGKIVAFAGRKSTAIGWIGKSEISLPNTGFLKCARGKNSSEDACVETVLPETAIGLRTELGY